MSQYKEAEIGDNVYFWFAANGTDGAAGDGATPLFDVRLAGAAADAAPTASGTPTLLSHASYGAGLHEILVDTDGYAAGEYAVFCTLTISTVNPGGFVGSFKLVAVGASVSSRVEVLRTAFILQDTTIVTAGRTTTQCALTAGAGDNDAYNGMYVILDNSAGSGGFTARKITDYVGASKTVVWSPAVTGTPEDGGRIIIVSGDAFNTLANISYACDEALKLENLNHWMKEEEDGDVTTNSGLGKLAATDGDWSKFVKGTDSLQAIRDRGDSAWVTATGFALASVVGALADAAAAGEVTEADTLMKYIKQLINILIGSAGVGVFPAEAPPANGVSLAEIIRAIHADVTGLNGDPMRGTNSAALASVCTEGRLGELDAANLPADVDSVKAVTEKLDSMIEVIS